MSLTEQTVFGELRA